MIDYHHPTMFDAMSHHYICDKIFNKLSTDFKVNVLEELIEEYYDPRPVSRYHSFAALKSAISTKCFVKDTKLRGQLQSLLWRWITKSHQNYDMYTHAITHGNHLDIIDLMKKTDATPEQLILFMNAVKSPTDKDKTVKSKPHVIDILLKDVHSIADLDRLLNIEEAVVPAVDVSPQPAVASVIDVCTQPVASVIDVCTQPVASVIDVCTQPVEVPSPVKPNKKSRHRITFGSVTYRAPDPIPVASPGLGQDLVQDLAPAAASGPPRRPSMMNIIRNMASSDEDSDVK